MLEPLGILLIIVVGALLGFFGDALFSGEVLFSWLGAIIACIVGAFIGGIVVPFGPQLFGLHVISALVGAVLLGLVFELILTLVARRSR